MGQKRFSIRFEVVGQGPRILPRFNQPQRSLVAMKAAGWGYSAQTENLVKTKQSHFRHSANISGFFTQTSANPADRLALAAQFAGKINAACWICFSFSNGFPRQDST